MSRAVRTDRRCPGCSARMLSHAESTSAIIDGCDACGGVWLNRAASRLLIAAELSDGAREFITMLSERAAADDNPYRAAAVGAARVCPVCDEELTPVRLQAPKIAIDSCSAHGCYLDHGEVGSIWVEASVQAAKAAIGKRT